MFRKFQPIWSRLQLRGQIRSAPSSVYRVKMLTLTKFLYSLGLSRNVKHSNNNNRPNPTYFIKHFI